MNSPVSLQLLLFLSLASVCIDAYKHVIIVHGLFDGPKEFGTMSLFINKVGCATTCDRVLRKITFNIGEEFLNLS